MKSLAAHNAKVHDVQWSHDGKCLASGDKDGTVSIWDARADKFLVGAADKERKMKHKAAVKVTWYFSSQRTLLTYYQALAWCPWKPELLATGSVYPEGIIRIWSTTSSTSRPSPLYTIPLNTSVTSLHWSPHCKELLSTHGSTWSTSSTAVAPTGPLKRVFSPLANSVTVHAYPSCKRLISVPAHTGVVSHSCLSPDGTSLFTLSPWEESMKMWKVWGRKMEAERRESVFDQYTIR